MRPELSSTQALKLGPTEIVGLVHVLKSTFDAALENQVGVRSLTGPHDTAPIGRRGTTPVPT